MKKLITIATAALLFFGDFAIGQVQKPPLENVTSLAQNVCAISIVSGVLAPDLSKCKIFTVPNTANITTFQPINCSANATGLSVAIMVQFVANGTGFFQTWGSSVIWTNASPISFTTTAAAWDWVTFVSIDGCQTWSAFYAQNFHT